MSFFCNLPTHLPEEPIFFPPIIMLCPFFATYLLIYRKSHKKYHSVLFLYNNNDKKLLIPGKRLYGQVTPSTATIFITPYPPPNDILPVIGIVQCRRHGQHQQDLPINLLVEGNAAKIHAFADNVPLPLEIIYASACYERTPFNKDEMELLWQKRVLVLGGGTGGSKICLELARAGVGNFTICDPQRLEYANISRHEGALPDVGKPKVDVIAERIYGINPAIKTEPHFDNIFDRTYDQVKDIFARQDIAIVSTDKTAIQLQSNEFTHKLGIPAVFGGCYEEARGGEVFFTVPEKKTPCLACLRGGLRQPQTNGKIDYSTAKSTEDYQGQPGLHAAIDFVTCVEVMVSLGVLLRDSETSQLGKLIKSASNFILIGGAMAEGFYRFRKPFDIFFQPLSGRRKTCPVCQGYADVLEGVDNILTNNCGG